MKYNIVECYSINNFFFLKVTNCFLEWTEGISTGGKSRAFTIFEIQVYSQRKLRLWVKAPLGILFNCSTIAELEALPARKKKKLCPCCGGGGGGSQTVTAVERCLVFLNLGKDISTGNTLGLRASTPATRARTHTPHKPHASLFKNK